MQVSSMVSSQEKNYKYSIGYKDDDQTITSACVKSYDSETKYINVWVLD